MTLNRRRLKCNKGWTTAVAERKIMFGRLIFAFALAAACCGAAVAQPNFTASRGVVEPAAPYAGDVVRHVFTITNTGWSVGPVFISTSLRRGFLIGTEGDCAGASVDSSGDLRWHEGGFDSGVTRRCTVTMLTRATAAGTFANVVTEIRVIPSGYHRVEAAAELGTRPDPHAVRVGPVMMTRAGMVVTAVLALMLVGALVIVARSRLQVEAPLGESAPSQPTGILVGAWAATLMAVGFLLFFVALAHEDWRAYSDYRETRCTVFGSEVDSFQSRSRSRDQEQSYKPMFAVRYPVDGVETFSTGYTTASAFNFNTRASAGSVFDRFAIGTTHPCWYDPQDTRTVVLARGPGGAYIFALMPIPILLIGLSMLKASRRRKRDAVPGAGITSPRRGLG
jgi:hypothetical protein